MIADNLQKINKNNIKRLWNIYMEIMSFKMAQVRVTILNILLIIIKRSITWRKQPGLLE